MAAGEGALSNTAHRCFHSSGQEYHSRSIIRHSPKPIGLRLRLDTIAPPTLDEFFDHTGATPHFDYVAAEVSKGIAQVGLDTGLPVSFGVLTTDSIEQAVERAGAKAGNKGWDAAVALIEMINILRQVE